MCFKFLYPLTYLLLIGRKSTYLQYIYIYIYIYLSLVSRQVVYNCLAISMRLAYKIKTSIQTKYKKSESLSPSLPLFTFYFSLFKLPPVSRLLSSSLCHYHIATSLSFHCGQIELSFSIFSSFLIFLFLYFEIWVYHLLKSLKTQRFIVIGLICLIIDLIYHSSISNLKN